MRRRAQSLLLSIMATTAFLLPWPWAASGARPAARDDGQWEQGFLGNQVRLVYHTQHFRVGGEALITVENVHPAKIALNIEQSQLAEEGLGLKTEHITFDPDLSELHVKLPDSLPSREFRYRLAFKCVDEYKPICARQRPTLSRHGRSPFQALCGAWRPTAGMRSRRPRCARIATVMAHVRVVAPGMDRRTCVIMAR
jgi:hypothetical protein